jgi:hypothetical protein
MQGIWLCFVIALAACKESGSTAGPVDTGLPVVGSAISFSELAPTSVTVSWGAADDDWSSAKSLRYKLTGISLRFPDGSELAFASRVPATWPGAVDEIKRREPGWLMGPAELPVFARQVGIPDSPHEGW